MSTAYLNGSAVFGLAVQCEHTPKASASQINNFFGVTGSQSLWGGGRGRSFMIQGVLVGISFDDLASAEQLLLSYDDGIARTLTDTWGVSWPNVVFYGEYQRQGKPGFGAQIDPDTGAAVAIVCQPYKAVLHGLT